MGSLKYKWRRPGSEDELHKTVLFERVNCIILCSGFYSSQESSWDKVANYLKIPSGPFTGGFGLTGRVKNNEAEAIPGIDLLN